MFKFFKKNNATIFGAIFFLISFVVLAGLLLMTLLDFIDYQQILAAGFEEEANPSRLLILDKLEVNLIFSYDDRCWLSGTPTQYIQQVRNTRDGCFVLLEQKLNKGTMFISKWDKLLLLKDPVKFKNSELFKKLKDYFKFPDLVPIN